MAGFRYTILLPLGIFSFFNLGTSDDFQEAALSLHNKFRGVHHTPPLYSDSRLQQVAQRCAQNLAINGRLVPSKNGYGENLYYFHGGAKNDTEAVEDAVINWYTKVSTYDFNRPGFSIESGCFTQLVWANSLLLGVGVARSGNKVYICANYHPPGNVEGQFRQNVLRA